MREWADIEGARVCPECEGVTWDEAVEEWGEGVRTCDYHRWLKDREAMADSVKEAYYHDKYGDCT